MKVSLIIAGSIGLMICSCEENSSKVDADYVSDMWEFDLRRNVVLLEELQNAVNTEDVELIKKTLNEKLELIRSSSGNFKEATGRRLKFDPPLEAFEEFEIEPVDYNGRKIILPDKR